MGLDPQVRRAEFIPSPSSETALVEPSPRPPVHSKNSISAVAGDGVGMLFDVHRGVLPANEARVNFNALIEQRGISAQARAQLSITFTAGLLGVVKARKPRPVISSRPEPADLQQLEPVRRPFDPNQPDGELRSVGPTLSPPEPDTTKAPTFKSVPSPKSTSENLRTTRNNLPPTFRKFIGLAARPLDQEGARLALNNDLEARAEALSRFANSFEGITRRPATELARAAIEGQVTTFWQLYGFAIDTDDRELSEASIRDIGEFLGGQAAQYLNAGLSDAARIYAFLSPQARGTLVDGFLGALTEAANGRFSGILDSSSLPFTRRTLPQALTVSRARRPGLRQPRRNASAGSLDKPELPTRLVPGSGSSSDVGTLAQKRALILEQNKAKSLAQENEIFERLKRSRFFKKVAKQ